MRGCERKAVAHIKDIGVVAVVHREILKAYPRAEFFLGESSSRSPIAALVLV